MHVFLLNIKNYSPGVSHTQRRATEFKSRDRVLLGFRHMCFPVNFATFSKKVISKIYIISKNVRNTNCEITV